jgi:hypothetical protein
MSLAAVIFSMSSERFILFSLRVDEVFGGMTAGHD